MCSIIQDIRRSYASLRFDKKWRHKDIAQYLELSEAELLDAHLGISPMDVLRVSPYMVRSIRLKKVWPTLIDTLESLGELKVITRNSWCLHQAHMFFSRLASHMSIGCVRTDHIDLMCFFDHWEHGYYFEENKDSKLYRSFRFFDEYGQPIHQIHLLPQSCHEMVDAIVSYAADPHQDIGVQVMDLAPKYRKERQLDQATETLIRVSWENAENIQELHGLIKRLNISRSQALHCLTEESAKSCQINCFAHLLRDVIAQHVELKIAIGNRGVMQLYKGPIDEIELQPAWMNLHGQAFDLSLAFSGMREMWWTRKPIENGCIHSLELLDASGDPIVIFMSDDSNDASTYLKWEQILKTHGCIHEAKGIQ